MVYICVPLMMICLFTSYLYPDTPKIALDIPLNTTKIESPALSNNEPTTVPEQKSIFIKNAITPEMVAYKHWTGTHKPDQFSIEINNEELKSGEEKTVSPNNGAVEVVYRYSFAKGTYKGSKTYSVAIPEKTARAALEFSWEKEPRLWVTKLDDK